MASVPKRLKLTQKNIASFKYRGVQAANGKWTRDVRWDTEVRGLGLRVLPSKTGEGRHERRFVLFYRHRGRQRLMTLGRFGTITLDQARRRARRLLAAVEEGHDPMAEREHERRAGSVGELCAHYLQEHASQRKTAKKIEQRIERHILPRWRTVKAGAITMADVQALHSSIGRASGDQAARPYEANRVLELVRSLFGFAERHGYVERGQENPANGVFRFKEESRKRRLSREELPRVLAAIDAEPDIYVRGLFWLYLLTGCRKNELLRAKWSDIRWGPPTLVLPDTKSGQPHEVPLSDESAAILRELDGHSDARTLGNPHVFPGEKPGRPRHNVDAAWSRIRERANVEDVRLHDLRRTVGSWLADEGHSLHLVGALLNHRSSKTTEVYARLSDDTLRRAVAAHGNRIAKAGRKRSASAQVVDLATAKKKAAGS